ncbi:type I restriction endonuclease subunit R [Neglecta sp. X4]|uniref:type I restriction endonuclease subunit R n=1 Tax=unclassified Neglectibacter TaxID=2632164 RepID=UPI001368BA61|nr:MULTISPECIES: type I restriction endonuclease subunit R [unclassified Neglectibacter]NBI16705.1 type I restriction endonuclease subunit R [Neglectibacter sp. 59]NBJ72985.1 type I restriction endonuclease subunit R [Neglectibacter sp. X4]NBK79606.1 type I restriction endonuclease subunit R [bacterium D16-76]NCE80819.1 type I restriction endonuclease subunit R [Neglectibacter sp. X58]
MPNFNEHALEMSIMQLFQDEGYTYLSGEKLHRERSEVLLTEDIRSFLLNRYVEEGLTPSEVENIILMLKSVSGTLYEANKTFMKMLCDGFIFNREDRTQKDIFIELVDFNEPDKNTFKIINQMEIDGINNQKRIPDGVVYVNGLPLVVFEFKSAVKENTTISDAYTQLTVRYRRDIPELFKYNAFVVISDGANNKYGSFFSPYDFFYAWRKVNPDDRELDGIDSLVTMVQGLFRTDRLLAVIKDFIYFPDSSDKDLKIVCRYPQYFAASKLFDNIKLHQRPEGDGKGGTYFGATGCGKSYTMLFLTRMLMKSTYFHSPTILVITDRTDLDDQLSKLFVGSKKYIGDDTVISIDSRETLRRELQGRESGGVYLTTIQKFTEDLDLLTDRENVICISDEAHRSQINLDQKVRVTEDGVSRTYGFAKYLHDSLPNATYVGFTGTPIDATIEVFGAVVDAYTMTEAVQDGITVNLVYDGRAARVLLDQDKVREIEEYYDKCEAEGANEYQIEESQKAVAHLDMIIGDPDRLRAVAEDFITHYETRVAEGATVAGKAMFVCSNRTIAYQFYKIVTELRPEWTERKVCPDGVALPEEDKRELKPIEKIKMVMTRNKDDEEALYNMLGTKDDRKELDRQFKNEKSNFKIAIVVDMWLTGFDVPALDTIYIDKPIQQHTLIQTISRVNRVCEGKEKGLVVDYIGIKKNMNLALKKYTNFEADEFEGIEQSVTIVKDQLEVLSSIFYKFNSSRFFEGTPKEQLECLNKAVEFVQLSEEMETRFMAAVKRMKQAFNLCSSSDAISDEERNYIHFYCAVRSVLFKLTKGEAPDISQMNARVRELLEGAIQSDGIEELFETGKHISVDIFSDEYMDKINAIQLPNTKVKLLQRLLSQAINEYKKVNKIKGIEFGDRLRRVVDEYNNRRRDEAYANEVLDDVAEQLAKLLEELKADKNSFEEMGISYEEKAFYDILKAVAKKYEFDNEYDDEKMRELARRVKAVVDDKTKYTDCFVKDDIKASMKVDLILLLDEFGYPPVTMDDVYKEVLEQAENFKKYAE